MLSGALLGLFLALCAVTWSIDQIIAGTVINIFVAGLTSFLYTQGKSLTGSLPEFDVPLLHEIPLLGPAIFENTPIAYIAMGLVVVLYVGLFHTRWGLRSRAVGEHPNAADSVGINVGLKRYVNTALAGGLAGLGGAFLSLEAVGTFERGMSAQRGFTALAIMIFGRWQPFLAWAGALFFAFTSRLAAQLQFDQVIDVPPQFINILPYVLVIVVLAVFAGRVRPPGRRRQAVREGVTMSDAPTDQQAPLAIEARDLTKRFGSALRQRPRVDPAAARRDPRAARRERRRQEHAGQDAVRAVPARRGRDPDQR